MAAPHDVPTATELLEAVREWIGDVGASGEPVNRFHARVAANVLAIVARELELGPHQAERHAQRMASLGVVDDAELVTAIRSGILDDRADEVRGLVWESVRDKLAVANPSYLDRVEPTDD
jgi:hypothetical protein